MSPIPADHSVSYTVESVSQSLGTISLNQFSDLRYVRVQWVDISNGVRMRIVPMGYSVVNEVIDGYTTVGEYLLRFDMGSLRLCPYAVGHVVLMACFEEKVPKPIVGGGESVEVSICPRTILRRVVRQAKETLGVEFIVGFESEFVLLSSTHPPRPINNAGWCMASGFDAGTTGQKVLDEIVEAVQMSGIELQMFHAESAPGQVRSHL